MTFRRRYILERPEMILVSLGDPYRLFDYPYLKEYINAYSNTAESQKAALKVKKIDFEKHTMLIDENVTNKLTPEERAKGKTYAITDRKTHSALVEDIPEALEPLLKKLSTRLSLSQTILCSINQNRLRRSL